MAFELYLEKYIVLQNVFGTSDLRLTLSFLGFFKNCELIVSPTTLTNMIPKHS